MEHVLVGMRRGVNAKDRLACTHRLPELYLEYSPCPKMHEAVGDNALVVPSPSIGQQLYNR
eukprot:6444028-Amphidinium_carterae.1